MRLAFLTFICLFYFYFSKKSRKEIRKYMEANDNEKRESVVWTIYKWFRDTVLYWPDILAEDEDYVIVF